MLLPILIFAGLYFPTLFLYFFAETSGNMRFRAPVKIALTLMFSAFAIVFYLLSGDLVSYKMFFPIAMVLATIGDILLLKYYLHGGAAFGLGNIAFCVFHIFLLQAFTPGFQSYWWFLLIFVAMMVPTLVLLLKEGTLINAKNLAIPTACYFPMIIAHGSLGVAVFVNGLGKGFWLLGLGSVLFMLSDFVLLVENFSVHFRKNPWLLRLNSALYFTGMFLLAIGYPLLFYAV